MRTLCIINLYHNTVTGIRKMYFLGVGICYTCAGLPEPFLNSVQRYHVLTHYGTLKKKGFVYVHAPGPLHTSTSSWYTPKSRCK